MAIVGAWCCSNLLVILQCLLRANAVLDCVFEDLLDSAHALLITESADAGELEEDSGELEAD